MDASNAAGDGQAALDLAGALCTRLCHDLAGTLGALSGTLDLVAEGDSQAVDQEALALARTCAREVSDRLRLLRAAWGRDTEVPGLESVLPGLPGAERLHVDLEGLSPEPDGPTRALALSLLLAAAAALPRGGTIRLQGSTPFLALHIEGVRAGWPEALKACLASPGGLAEAGLEPRSIGFAVACLQARALGLTLRISSPLCLEAAPAQRR